jgi:hypothetical protein
LKSFSLTPLKDAQRPKKPQASWQVLYHGKN